ncbi:hypothetical protein KQX54_021740 [Cotesia glomerata]|uniref:Uncharacterized protein n=1 Tax=Cotesia glomerata TaxID=32391 RepID=A0AAV7JAJ2_COTGL|nr:hypothetical protein KQX54_021740 [Cotesia glomerata]
MLYDFNGDKCAGVKLNCVLYIKHRASLIHIKARHSHTSTLSSEITRSLLDTNTVKLRVVRGRSIRSVETRQFLTPEEAFKPPQVPRITRHHELPTLCRRNVAKSPMLAVRNLFWEQIVG